MNPTELVDIPGGVFAMGSRDFYPDEGPVHEREVADFRLERHPVTNAQFARFVHETGYVTIAERPLDPRDFPQLSDDERMPGAMVFTPTAGPADLGDWRQWWRWQPGASWAHPQGAGSGLEGLDRHPVVMVAYPDAVAYAEWAGRRLPTEAEFEYAARGGGRDAPYAWGEEPFPADGPMANTWLGRFPYDNRGVGGTSPVGSYPANGYGLLDTIGNVWEWTSSLYTSRHVPGGRISGLDPGDRPHLLGAAAVAPARRVLKGGSFLCSPDYCLRFRPAARSAQSDDTGMSHIGFRCAADL